MDDSKNLDLIKIDDDLQTLAQQVIDESEISKTNDLITLFNWNISKKNVARVLKLNNLFDTVTDQMAHRITAKPDQFSNSDLLDYLKAVQGAIDHSDKLLDAAVEEPPKIVQTNNTQVNITVLDKFDREARARILAAVQSTLNSAASDNMIDISSEESSQGE